MYSCAVAVAESVRALHVVDVVIESRSGGGEAIYTYAAEGEIARGDALLVPLASRSVMGFALRTRKIAPEELGFDPSHLRRPQGRIDGVSLPEMLMDLVEFTSREYLCPLPVALSAAVPPGVRDRLVSAWRLDDSADPERLTDLQREILRTLQDSGGSLVQKKGSRLAPGSEKALKLLRAKGLVRQSLRLAAATEPKQPAEVLKLTSDVARVDSFLRDEGRKKPAQALTLMRLQEAEDARLTAVEIRGLSGIADTTIRALVGAGLLEVVDPSSDAMRPPPLPNPHQGLAIQVVSDAIRAHRASKFLLFGVTGSGKTEVYLRAASEALQLGRQVLYLVPEIALATQAVALLRERFGKRVAVLHSELRPAERIDAWMRIRSGDAAVVLGARSALFSPLTNLGLIILDEEHEGSYKQESSPRYHAKDLAGFLADRHSCPLVLGSATPSVESFYSAEQGRLELLSLPKRVASAQLPAVHVIDLSEGYRTGRPSILGEELVRRMSDTLDRSEQVILFLNRRAYAPFLICRDCGRHFACPRCAVSLAYSRKSRRLRCHHCGYNSLPPELCPACNGSRLNPFGVGTEKVEEAVMEAFPNARVARLDRDIAQKKGALEQVLAGFRSGEMQVLVGTQMVAKGLDFPRVTLVGVIAADISLNIPDFRASERTFQLLSQVAGRAGRGSAPGHVVIQTFNPEHVSVQAARDHAFAPLYDAIKLERIEAGYPPFKRLINVVVSGEDRLAVVDCSEQVARLMSGVQGVEILGPTDCALERLHSRWRRHILAKLSPYASVGPIGEALHGRGTKSVQVMVDVDPYSLM